MVDVTDAYFRRMARILSKRVTLYTPMITDLAILRGPHAPHKFIPNAVDSDDAKTIVQLGGSDPATMCAAAKLCEAAGYAAVNINLGCPAESAVDSEYGAALMLNPATPDLIHAVRQAVSIPVTVKMRIGVYRTMGQCNKVPYEEKYEALKAFVMKIAARPLPTSTGSTHTSSAIQTSSATQLTAASVSCSPHSQLRPDPSTGVTHIILHCRAAILSYRPETNRKIPPLDYRFAYRLKEDFPHLTIELNGGVDTMEAIQQHLHNGVDGVMLGRLAWKDPFALTQIDHAIFREPRTTLSRRAAIEQYIPYAYDQLHRQLSMTRTIADWKPVVKHLLEPMIHMYTNTFNGKAFRVHLVEGNKHFLSQYMYGRPVQRDVDIREIVEGALKCVESPEVYTLTDQQRLNVQLADAPLRAWRCPSTSAQLPEPAKAPSNIRDTDDIDAHKLDDETIRRVAQVSIAAC